MHHPFDGISTAALQAEASPPRTTRRSVLRTMFAAATGLVGFSAAGQAREPDLKPVTTEALHEDGFPSTAALNEEGGVTSKALGEEGGRTTEALHEEGGISTAVTGEEGGITTKAAREEGSGRLRPTPTALCEEGGRR